MPLNETDNSNSNDKNSRVVDRRYSRPSRRINLENKSEILSVRVTAVQGATFLVTLFCQWPNSSCQAETRPLPYISAGTALNFSVALNRIYKAVVQPGTRLFLV